MSATKSVSKAEIRVVVDTNVFVPALAGREPEASFYSAAIRQCWKFVVSDQILEEYRRVIQKFGFRADVVIHAVSMLYAMEKYRSSKASPEAVPDELAPPKDRHIVAPCLEGKANLIVTHDGGILAKKQKILELSGARVLALHEAQAQLDTSTEASSGPSRVD